MMRLPRPLAVITRAGLTVLAGSSLLAATGCATASGTEGRPFKAVVFSIPYVDNCPGLPTSNFPCNGVTDCAVLEGGNATVEFKAIGTGSATREFKVQFDPFRETGLESHGNGTTGAVRVPKAHLGKSDSPKDFTFFIVDKKKPECVPVDPRIIVER
jgi:hypothetical protein